MCLRPVGVRLGGCHEGSLGVRLGSACAIMMGLVGGGIRFLIEKFWMYVLVMCVFGVSRADLDIALHSGCLVFGLV